MMFNVYLEGLGWLTTDEQNIGMSSINGCVHGDLQATGTNGMKSTSGVVGKWAHSILHTVPSATDCNRVPAGSYKIVVFSNYMKPFNFLSLVAIPPTRWP